MPNSQIKQFRIIVCGGRQYSDKSRVYQILDLLLPIKNNITIIQEDAQGADFLAKQWAADRSIKCENFPADWNKYKKAAGAIRNREMFNSGCDLVIAFPGGSGTQNMCDYAQSKECEIIKIDW